MYNVSSTFLSKIKEPSRTVKAKIDINGTVLTEAIIVDFTVESSMGSDRLPTIGGTVSTKLNLKLVRDVSVPALLIGVPIKPSVAIEISTGVFEWVPCGTFYANTGDVTTTDRTITIEAFDKMPTLDRYQYGSELTFPQTIQAMLTEIGTDYGITFETQTLPSVSFPSAPVGTVRQVLGQIASLISTNVIINRSGNMEFRFTNVVDPLTFTFDSNNYIDFKLTTGAKSKISQITVTIDDNTSYTSGDNTGLNVKFQNIAVTSQADVTTIFNRVYPLMFWSYTMKCQGFPHLNVGDIVTFTHKDSTVYQILIASNKLSYRGGLMSEFGCEAVKDNVTTVTMTGGSTVGQAILNYSKTVEQSIATATALLTGESGGTLYIRRDQNGKPYEILIMDNEDINSALKIWKWNANGLGFSSSGYNGTYATAITANGQVSASIISTGILNADLIQAGKIKSLNGMVEIDMLTGEFQFGGSGIQFSQDGMILESGSIVDELSGVLSPQGEYRLIKVGTLTSIVVTKSTDNITFTTAVLDTDYSITEDDAIYTLKNITAGDKYYKISYSYTTTLEQAINSKADGTTVDGINNYMVFTPTTGLTLGDKSGNDKVNISSAGIRFIKDGVTVAEITGSRLYITQVTVTDSIIIGSHELKSYSSEITYITWAG